MLMDLLLLLTVHATPAVSPATLAERWLSMLSTARCEAARNGQAAITVLAPSWKTDHVEWARVGAARCSISPATIPWQLGAAAVTLEEKTPPAEGAPVPSWGPDDLAPAITRVLRLPVKPLQGREFNRYTPRELQRLHAAIFVPPDTPMAGTTAQQVYDTMLKRSVTSTVDDLLWLEAKLDAKALGDLLRAYRAKVAAKEAGFEPNPWLYGELQARLGTDPHLFSASPLLGVMLRRTADGTWPTLRGLLEKTLQAYDAPLAQRLAARPGREPERRE